MTQHESLEPHEMLYRIVGSCALLFLLPDDLALDAARYIEDRFELSQFRESANRRVSAPVMEQSGVAESTIDRPPFVIEGE